ncbi:uncharacterized protein LOC108910282 [Anoplophora glabripennis]|uniref:Protein UXT n=1 Tax=Anoplophora glabripennis TaxID=217634 RepID=V5GBC9_ANOGL|nr:uncharacterized protein LOC108910282 [Anoplophora glabripennis]
MNSKEVERKIEEYEQFVEKRLKEDLKDIEVILNSKVSKYKDWEDVKQIVKTLKEFKAKDSDMSVRLDIGRGILLTGEIEDFESTYVCIGLGYMLEMDCDEANKYSDIRLKLLKKEIDHFRKLAVDVKVHIKMVLLAINELQVSLIPPTLKKS